jgi:hypothetical protein
MLNNQRVHETTQAFPGLVPNPPALHLSYSAAEGSIAMPFSSNDQGIG